MVNEAETNRPYAPPSNVVAVLRRLRSRNLPERIDLDYLRDSGIGEGTVHRVLFAIRFLGLIGAAGEPTPALRAIHTSTDEEYREMLAGRMREAYADVFNSVDPSEDSQERIVNVFRRYTPASQRSRMVIFFLGMCKEAGIPTLDAPRQRSMADLRLQPVTGRAKVRNITFAGTRRPPSSGALQGLIADLPQPGQPMSKTRREQWITMARAVLDYLYPEGDDARGEEDDE